MLLCFPNLAPELVPRIFDLFSSRKPGWNFSYEPKAKFIPVTEPAGQPGSYEEALSVDVEWFSKTEKNVSLKERKAHFLSLTQYSPGVELKFVECVNFCCWAWLKYAVTLKENLLNVTWFWWAWLKSLLTLIKNLLNVKTILLLEFCTIWLSIPAPQPPKCFITRLPLISPGYYSSPTRNWRQDKQDVL